MDSTWFAVDEDGHIGVFDTGDEGPKPVNFPSISLDEPDPKLDLEEEALLAQILWDLACSDECLRKILPPSRAELEKQICYGEVIDYSFRFFRSLGVFTYSCDFCTPVAYAKVGEVQRPIGLEKLDESTQEQLRRARLPVRFSETPAIAPGEFEKISAWTVYWFDSTGRARPVEGLEDEFEAWIKKAGELDPENFRVEALDGKHYEGEELYSALEVLLYSDE